jgi:hypothetical protein
MTYTLKLDIYIVTGVAIDYITIVTICYILVDLIALSMFLVLQLLMMMIW